MELAMITDGGVPRRTWRLTKALFYDAMATHNLAPIQYFSMSHPAWL
jgi:hypothetical protein